MKKLLSLWCLVFVGCGSNTPNVTVNPVVVSSPVPAPTESAVQQIVDQQNAYRASVGQEPITSGLDCSIYTVPTTTVAIIGATSLVGVGSFQYQGVFNQPESSTSVGLNVFPLPLQQVYQNWYLMKCTGYLISGDSNWHEFDISSDDGSNLYIDGALLINNDGLHVQTDKAATKLIEWGVHSFELDFLQGAGNQALILNEDNTVMSSSGFYH